MRNFRQYEIVNDNGTMTAVEGGVFQGKTPRQAALKVANNDIKLILMRERGTSKVNVYIGERKQEKKPETAPAWMPALYWKPNVHAIGLIKFKHQSEILEGLPEQVKTLTG